MDADRARWLKDQLRAPVRRALELLSVPPGVRPHLQDRLVRAGLARIRSLPRLGRMWAGTEILWPRPGAATLGVCELPAPGPGEVLVQAAFTAVSPGTERAFLNFVPGVLAVFPIRPGYSGSGTVIAAGRSTRQLGPGKHVACSQMPHASLALLPAERVFALPDGVGLEAAALLELLVIAQQAVRKGCIQPGSDVTVIGAGLVGLLALQIARARGAASVSVVAASGAKRNLALAAGAARFIDLAREPRLLDRLGSPVVIEATGSPEGLWTAVGAAAPAARVVLLGSTRGMVTGVDFDALLRRKELTLVGAHISTVPWRSTPDGPVAFPEEAAECLRLLATRAIDPAALLTERLDPLEAAIFYRRLCQGDQDIVGALFDWELLPAHARRRRSFVLAPPPDLMRPGRPLDVNDGPPSVIPRRRNRPPLCPTAGALPPASGPLRFALIGCGGMGARHAEAIRKAPNTVLVATMDTDPSLARELAGDVFHTTSLEEVLARPDVDAVFIATPNHLHEPMGVEAARAGKHVVVEKPMAHTLEAADRLLRACREAGVALSVGYAFRYSPEIETARHLVRQGVLGRLVSVQFTVYLDKSPAYWGSGYTGRAHSPWRTRIDRSGGGMLVMNMSHQLDQVRYVLGKEMTRVVSVSGVLDSPPGVEVEDVISIACEFEDGAIGSFFGSASARGLENLVEMRLVGDVGTIVLERPFRFFTLRSVDGLSPGRWHAFGTLRRVDVNASYIAWFADAVLAGRCPPITGEDGRTLQAWIEAAYEAARQGRPVEVRMEKHERGTESRSPKLAS